MNRLTRRINGWKHTQSVYMPSATIIRHLEDVNAVEGQETACTTKLLLPSAVGRVRCLLDQALVSAEKRLRVARAEDALAQVRELIILRSLMYNVKERDIRGQKRSGRSHAMIKQVDERIFGARERYDRHYAALCALDPLIINHDWRQTLQPLLNEHVVAPADTDGSEGRRTFTWIWLASNTSDEAGMQEGTCMTYPPATYFLTCFFFKYCVSNGVRHAPGRSDGRKSAFCCA